MEYILHGKIKYIVDYVYLNKDKRILTNDQYDLTINIYHIILRRIIKNRNILIITYLTFYIFWKVRINDLNSYQNSIPICSYKKKTLE